jgi:hypothetical protein
VTTLLLDSSSPGPGGRGLRQEVDLAQVPMLEEMVDCKFRRWSCISPKTLDKESRAGDEAAVGEEAKRSLEVQFSMIFNVWKGKGTERMTRHLTRLLPRVGLAVNCCFQHGSLRDFFKKETKRVTRWWVQRVRSAREDEAEEGEAGEEVMVMRRYWKWSKMSSMFLEARSMCGSVWLAIEAWILSRKAWRVGMEDEARR